MKKEIDSKEDIKARWVARGFQEEKEIKPESPTVSELGIRVLFATAASKEWPLEVTDMKSAFLQGDQLDRGLNMEPEYKKLNVIWRLDKAVYGRNDAPLKWYERLDKDFITLGCVCSKLDTACYIYREERQLAGIVCIYVDDVIAAGNNTFNEKVPCRLKYAFLIGKAKEGAFRYVGTNIKQQGDRIVMNQEHYINRTELIDLAQFAGMSNDDALDESGQALFRSKVGSLNWLSVQTRPDIAHEVIELSTCFKKVTVKNLKEVNSCIKMVKSEKVNVVYPKLGHVAVWKIMTFADGAHANLPDKVSGSGGHIVFLLDENGSSCPLIWASYKIQRIVGSSLSAEAMTIQDSVESSLYIKEMLLDVLSGELKGGVKLPVGHVTNISLKNTIYCNSQVKDKRLRIYLASLKQECLERLQSCAVNSQDAGTLL